MSQRVRLPRALSRTAGADAFGIAAARLRAQRPLRDPRLQKIASNLRSGRFELAGMELTGHLDRYPDDADATCLKARAIHRLGRPRTAAALYVRCLELAPDFSAARFQYAKLLVQLHKYEAALLEIDQLLIGDERNPLFRQLKASIHGAIGDDEQSLVIWQELTAETPGRTESWISYGHALRATGFQEKSIAAYRKAIDCRPSFGSAWWSLANLKTFRFSKADIDAMQEQLTRQDVAADDRINLLFSLGKAYEDLLVYERSFEHYVKANAARRVRIDYDWDAIASRVTSNKTLFTPEFLRSRSGVGCKAPGVIFIFGRPRSGSTLIEQILSSHSAIEGTAELPYIAALADRLEECECRNYGCDYPQILERLPSASLAALGEEYLKSTRTHRKLGRRFFIDKAPANYHQIGMIHLILPNAKIIDARRHPAACCLSMFKHNYADSNLRLGELGRVYRGYVELMAHFDRVLPGRIHRVIYEDMVGNPEAEIRKMLAYLGLPFEESCLRFYETERAIRTPSSEQVRRPISGEAVDHWRNFEPWLGQLKTALGSVLDAYPDVPVLD